MANTPQVIIYTDGACSGNPGPGGWGALLRFGNHEKELSGAAEETTNNRMEITAAVMAFRALKEPCQVDIYTDSEYLKKGITDWIHNWKKLGWRRGSPGKTRRWPMLTFGRNWIMRSAIIKYHGTGCGDMQVMQKMSASMSWLYRQ